MMWRIMKFMPADQDAAAAPSSVPDDLDADADDAARVVEGHQVLLGRRQRARTAHPEARTTAACSIRRCPRCGWTRTEPTDYVVARGKGTVFSFVVHHAPKVPGRTLPFVIALVELEEGVRMLGELRNVDPASVEIGMPVRATYIDFPASDVGPAWTLYAWEPRRMSAPVDRGGHQAARTQALRRPDVHRVHRDRHPRLPGRAPRPGQGAGQGVQGHLRQHPHRHRSGAALHHRLGRADRGDQVDRAAARCAVVRLRHRDVHRRGDRGRGRIWSR